MPHDDIAQEAHEIYFRNWGYTSWAGIQKAEEDLAKRKRDALKAAGWRYQTHLVVPGVEMWSLDDCGVQISLPLDLAVRLQMQRSMEEARSEAYDIVQKERFRQAGREAPPGTPCPYPVGSYGAAYWLEGHKENK